MSDILLRSESAGKKTCVPHFFIDEYMPQANGEYVKIYIYILRCFEDDDMTISTSDIADRFDLSEKSVIRSLHYWAEQGLLELSFNKNAEINGITFFTDPEAVKQHSLHKPAVSHNTGKPRAKAPIKVNGEENIAVPEKHYASYTPMADSRISDADRRELVHVAETYLGRIITAPETEKLFSWMDELALPYEVIDYLIDYSISKGHDSFTYMNKIACDWSKENIKTVEMAKAYSQDREMAPVYKQIQTNLGITSRAITPTEKNYIRSWMISMGMPLDMILNACDRTIKNTGRASFEYTDSIIKSWHGKNIMSLDEVNALDDEYRSRFVKKSVSGKKSTDWNFEQRDYDMDIIEKQLLNKR